MTTTARRLEAAIAGLTFHPADVEFFGHTEAVDLLGEILVDEFGWTAGGLADFQWGDSGTPTVWLVSVGAFGTVTIDELEAGVRIARTQFEGGYRTTIPRALRFLASNAS